MIMPRQHGSTGSETKPRKRRKEEEGYNSILTTNNITKVQKEEYFIKNACYLGNKVLSLQTDTKIWRL